MEWPTPVKPCSSGEKKAKKFGSSVVSITSEYFRSIISQIRGSSILNSPIDTVIQSFTNQIGLALSPTLGFLNDVLGVEINRAAKGFSLIDRKSTRLNSSHITIS